MTTATKKKTARRTPPAAPVVKTGNRAHRLGNAAVAIEFPNGQRAALSPVARPRNGRFYRHAFALYIGGERVAEFVHTDIRQANAQHDALARALESLAAPPPPPEDPK